MADVKKSSIQKKSGCYLLNIKQPERTNKRLKLSFQRLKASINTMKSDRHVGAAVGLLDISEGGAGFFTAELLAKGSAVEITITEPMILRIRAIVAWSIPITSGIAQPRFPCRSGLQFIYDNDIQRQAVKDFIEKVNADPMEIHRRNLAAAPTAPTPGTAEAQAAGVTPPPAEGAPAAPAEGAAPAEAAAPAAEGTPAPAPAAEAAPAAAADAFSTATEPAPAAAADAPAAAPTGEGETGGQNQAA